MTAALASSTDAAQMINTKGMCLRHGMSQLGRYPATSLRHELLKW